MPYCDFLRAGLAERGRDPVSQVKINLTETGGPERALVLQGYTARRTAGADTRDTGGPWPSTTLGTSKVFHTLIY